MVQHVSINDVNNINDENHAESVDKNRWIQVVTGYKKALRRQKHPRISTPIPTSNRFASL
jgi:hypothetical protein